MKLFIYFTFTFLFLANSRGQIAEVFYCKGYSGLKRIELKGDGTFYIIEKIRDVYQYSDTLSFGEYELIDKNIIEFNSTFQEATDCQEFYITMEITEERGNHPDTLYFKIENDFENQICAKEPNDRRSINYGWYINGKEAVSENHCSRLFANEFKIPKKDNLTYFSIIVIPNIPVFAGYMPFKLLYSDSHYLQNKEANIFSIKIPKLTVSYLSTMRLYSDYVLIKNKKTLIWHGEEFSSR